jgi:hypothetical protein
MSRQNFFNRSTLSRFAVQSMSLGPGENIFQLPPPKLPEKPDEPQPSPSPDQRFTTLTSKPDNAMTSMPINADLMFQRISPQLDRKTYLLNGKWDAERQKNFPAEPGVHDHWDWSDLHGRDQTGPS